MPYDYSYLTANRIKDTPESLARTQAERGLAIYDRVRTQLDSLEGMEAPEITASLTQAVDFKEEERKPDFSALQGNNALTWDKIVEHKRWRGLNPDEKEKIRDNFWVEIVLPNLNGQPEEVIRQSAWEHLSRTNTGMLPEAVVEVDFGDRMPPQTQKDFDRRVERIQMLRRHGIYEGFSTLSERTVPRWLTVGMSSFVDQFTFGMLPDEMFLEPETRVEKVFSGIGGAAGFVIGPGKVVAAPVSRLTQKGLVGTAGKLAVKPGVAGWFTRRGIEAISGAAGLGFASASIKPEDTTWLEWKQLTDRIEAFKHGAPYGVAFRWAGGLKKLYARLPLMSAVTGVPSTLAGDAAEDVAFNYGLGLFFGAKQHPYMRPVSRETFAMGERVKGKVEIPQFDPETLHPKTKLRQNVETGEIVDVAKDPMTLEQQAEIAGLRASQNISSTELKAMIRVASGMESEAELNISGAQKTIDLMKRVKQPLATQKQTGLIKGLMKGVGVEKEGRAAIIASIVGQEKPIEKLSRSEASLVINTLKSMTTTKEAIAAIKSVEAKPSAEPAAKEPYQMTFNEFKKSPDAPSGEAAALMAHTKIVEKAYTDGKTIPDNVLLEAHSLRAKFGIEKPKPKEPEEPPAEVEPEKPTVAIPEAGAPQTQQDKDKLIDEEVKRQTKEFTENSISKKVLENGGIKPYRDPEGKVVESEEYLGNVPLRLRRKDGLSPDEMANTLGFEGDSELYAELKSEADAKSKIRANIKREFDYFDEKIREESGVAGLSDSEIELMYSGITPEYAMEQARIAADAIDKVFNKGVLESYEIAFSRPTRIFDRYEAGKRYNRFLREEHVAEGLLAGKATRLIEDASRRLPKPEVRRFQEDGKRWIESGMPDIMPDGTEVTIGIRRFGEDYLEMKKMFAHEADKAGILVKVRKSIARKIFEQKASLQQLEALRDMGVEGLAKKIAGARRSIALREEQRDIKHLKMTNEYVWEPFSKHHVKNHFAHILTPEARNAIASNRGKKWEALKAMAKERNIDLKDLKDLADPVNASIDRKFASMERQRIADLPEKLIYDTDKNGNPKYMKVLVTDPFTEARWYINNAARRIGTVRTVRSFEGYSKDEIPHYSHALSRFIDEVKFGRPKSNIKGLVEEGAPDGTITIADGVWHAMMGTTKRIPGHVARNPIMQGVLSAESIATAGVLSFSQVTNAVGGWFPIFAEAGIRNTARAVVTVYKAGKTDIPVIGRFLQRDVDAQRQIEMMRDLMGFSYDHLRFSQESAMMSYGASKISRKALKALGFEFANRQLNKASSLAGVNFLTERIAKIRAGHSQSEFYRKQMKREFDFTDADIDRMVARGIDNMIAAGEMTDVARVAQTFAAKANLFRENPGDIPPWMRTEWGKRMMALQSFNRNMGNILADSIWEFKEGNPRKFITFLLGAGVSEVALDEIRKWAFDRDDLEHGFFPKLFMSILGSSSLGLMGSYIEDAIWVYRTGGDWEEALSAVYPPQGEFNWDLAKNLFNILWEHDRESVHKLAKDVPIFRVFEANVERVIQGKWKTNLNRRGRRRKSQATGQSGDIIPLSP